MLRDALPKVSGKLPGPNAKKALDKRAKVMPNAIGAGYPWTSMICC